MNWLDLALIILVIIFLIIGLKKGFMTSMLQSFSLGVNATLSFFFYKPIAFLLNKFGLGTAIATSYSTKLIGLSSSFNFNLLEFTSQSELKSFVSMTLKEGNFNSITKTMFNWFLNNDSLYSTLQSSGLESRTLAEIISETYSTFFVTIIAFVTSMILLQLIVFLIQLLVNKLRKVGFVKFVDNLLGVFYGLFRVLIILVIVSLVVKLLSVFSFMDSVIAYINDSFFGKLIYSTINNFFDNIFNFDTIVQSLFG